MNREAIDQLMAALAENPLTEIYIGGTLETGLGIPPELLPKNLPDWNQLAPRPRSVIIEVGGSSLFSVEVIVHPWEIDVVKLDCITPRFELEDDRFGFIGVLDMTLQIGEPPCPIERVDLFTFSDDEGGAHLASIGLVSSNDYIFLQGWRINGIKLGCSVARDAWIAEVHEQVRSTSFEVQRMKDPMQASPPTPTNEGASEPNNDQSIIPGFEAWGPIRSRR